MSEQPAEGQTASKNGVVRKESSLRTEIASSFATLLEMHSVQLYAHCRRVARWARLMAQACGMSAQSAEELEVAGFLHDLGLMALPNEILIRSGKDVETGERARQHPITGSTILSQIQGFERIAEGILHHHERFDGKGFPHRLWGSNIPIYSRILAIADTYDLALHMGIAQRARDRDEARKVIARERDAALDRDLVQVFMQLLVQSEDGSDHDENELELIPSALRPGMVLSRDLRSVNNVLLLKTGTQLTGAIIDRVLSSDMAGQMVTVAYVEASSIHEGEELLMPKPVAADLKVKARNLVGAAPEEQQTSVLVVDDSRAVAHALRRELARASMQVTGVTSGAEAMEVLANEEFQTVIVDLVLTDMSGIDLLRQIQEKHPGLQCVVLSGHTTPDNIRSLRALDNVVRFVRKPWAHDVLLSSVREAVDRGRSLANA
jgi:response regulator RpfG family c-di-GMP phosphodiesterase